MTEQSLVLGCGDGPPWNDASAQADFLQSLAMQQGVFDRREGNTLYLSGPIVMDGDAREVAAPQEGPEHD